ncbi:polymer-forming cytoskeletal protein [Aquabacterium sp.]|jgi:cytoskeletal protein CcmA (bactofilin family)|uniref:bactofilin family protein n=1 Tax=Aquabacterium sp. TaxID=1872578 RepID=UPI001D9D8FBF|nr:polymer-forming cytoskeletal protein [Aquabacterium sp.]MBT9611294.1 polymer-forming cytoskeletal protein [Aquabacterium sp.]
MFNWKKTPPIRTLIGEGTVITGEIRFSDGLRIDGELHGNVTSVGDGRSLLVISDKARVHGKVRAGHVIINGSVEGPVMAEELLELQPKARIAGDVRYESLEMHQGATIDGELRAMKSESKPGLKLAASSVPVTSVPPAGSTDRAAS